jgi:hypothetical protein
MHIYWAQKWAIKARYAPDTLPEFIRGTLFPDIRYLKVLKREDTHEKNPHLKDLIESKASPFIKGMKLHAYIDVVRERFVVQYKIYKHLSKISRKYHATFLKLVEDQIIWDKINHSQAITMLETLDDQERKWGVSEKDLLKWHFWLTNYLLTPPSDLLSLFAVMKKNFLSIPAKEIEKWPAMIESLAQNPIFKSYMKAMEKHFDEKFEAAFSPNDKK